MRKKRTTTKAERKVAPRVARKAASQAIITTKAKAAVANLVSRPLPSASRTKPDLCKHPIYHLINPIPFFLC